MSTANAVKQDESRERRLKDRIAALIKHTLDERDWSQATLARQAGIPRDNVSRYVRGISLPSSAHAHALARVMNTDVETLLGNTPTVNVTSVDVKLQPNGKYLLSLKKEFSAADLAKVLAAIEETDNHTA